MTVPLAGYLANSTDLNSPLNVTIPASVGPSADYYSLAFSDLTANAGPQYSNMFNLTGGTGVPTEYEQHLDGAPFWNADDLPCSAYDCARQCAQASYPNDLSDPTAYNTMKSCILKCPGVAPDASATGAPHASSTLSTDNQALTISGSGARITLGPSVVLTAMETMVTTGGSTLEEVILGSRTLTMGGAQATISSEAVSAITNGVVVDGSSTVVFSSMVATETPSGTASGSDGASATGASASATSSGAASRQEVGMAVAGVVGLAALFI